MELLSRDLITVLTNASGLHATLVLPYKGVVSQNVDLLDRIGAPLSQASPSERLNSFLRASNILFPGKTLVPDHQDYDVVKQKNWSSACWLPAGCIIKLSNSVEIALSLKLVTFFGTKFAVRSGGHMANPGFGSIGASGVLFDLTTMNAIDVSADAATVAVGPAATWDAIYEKLEKQERTVVGGRAAEVGAAGLILGGGMSHFSNYWGMCCDNVKNFQVVLADSSIVDANDSINQDLYSVLKGGGPNFGIVTRLDLCTYPDYTLWSQLKAYSAADIDRLTEAIVEVQNAMETDDRIGLFATIMPESIVIGFIYRGGAPEAGVFGAFDHIEPASELMPATMGTQCSLARALALPKPFKGNIGTLSIRPKATLYAQLHETLKECMKNSSPSVSAAFTIQPLGKRAVEKSRELGGNCMNIAPEAQAFVAVLAQSPEDHEFEFTQSKARQLVQSFDSVAAQHDGLLDFRFMNDSSALQSPLQGYGPQAVAALDAASRKWDPNGVFQELQNSGFLISKINAPAEVTK